MKNVIMGACTQEKVNRVTNTKIKEVNKLTKFERTTLKVATLKEKQDKTSIELKSLINLMLQLEDKTASAVYNKLSKAKGELKEYINIALGKSKFPTYKDFVTELVKKEKQWYSNWDGINVLTSFNKVAKTNTKVQRQNKKELAK
jgi:hypothetical protein